MKTIQIIATRLMMKMTSTALSNTNNNLTIEIQNVIVQITIKPKDGIEPHTHGWNTFPNQSNLLKSLRILVVEFISLK